MQKTLLKQTDNEIHFEVVYNKKGNCMHDKTNNIFRLLDFVFIIPASFEVPQAIT